MEATLGWQVESSESWQVGSNGSGPRHKHQRRRLKRSRAAGLPQAARQMRRQITPRCFRTQSRCGKSRAHRRAARPPCSGPRHPFSSAAPAGWPSSRLPRSPADEASKLAAVMQCKASCQHTPGSLPPSLLQPCPTTPPPSALATDLPYPARTLADDLRQAHAVVPQHLTRKQPRLDSKLR